MWFVSTFLACSLIFLVNSSRCPEPKKPHLTSCTIFYTCVNLPGGGYVWVPSRCNEGLIFQPYLRMCVVPGDIWTCDTLSTENSLTTDTNYLKYTPSEFSQMIDSSYVINDFLDSTTEAITVHPLIEFEELKQTTHVDQVMKNVLFHKEENYLFEYTNNQEQVSLPLIQKYKDIVDNHYKWINELMNRLHVYKELFAMISGTLSVPIRDVTTIDPTRIITIFASHNRKQNTLLNYLEQSSTNGNKLHKLNKPNVMEINESQIDNIATTESIVSTESNPELSIDSLNADNNIIKINDNLGNRKYFTINEYRTMTYRLTPQFVSVMACTRNIRLPNRTDCSRYYTCDPKTAAVIEYSCPLHTAFNINSRICDIESTKTCRSNQHATAEIFVQNIELRNKTINEERSSEEKLCQELGKMKDPASDSHYYICYDMPGSEDIKSIRMTCPNTLVFCQSKKVCTTRRLCDISR